MRARANLRARWTAYAEPILVLEPMPGRYGPGQTAKRADWAGPPPPPGSCPWSRSLARCEAQGKRETARHSRNIQKIQFLKSHPCCPPYPPGWAELTAPVGYPIYIYLFLENSRIVFEMTGLFLTSRWNIFSMPRPIRSIVLRSEVRSYPKNAPSFLYLSEIRGRRSCRRVFLITQLFLTLVFLAY